MTAFLRLSRKDLTPRNVHLEPILGLETTSHRDKFYTGSQRDGQAQDPAWSLLSDAADTDSWAFRASASWSPSLIAEGTFDGLNCRTYSSGEPRAAGQTLRPVGLFLAAHPEALGEQVGRQAWVTDLELLTGLDGLPVVFQKALPSLFDSAPSLRIHVAR